MKRPRAKFLSPPDMREVLERAVNDAGSIAEFARRHELSPSTVSSILHGVRPVTWVVARILGYSPVQLYRKRDAS